MFGVYSDNNQSNIISYSDFWDNGNDIKNFTIGNGVIYENPMFLNADTGNFSLSENSPCIDVGDPNSAFDPDGTRVDMGALPFDHTIPVELAVFNAEVKDDDIILSWTTASETNNFGFEILRRDEGKDFKKIGLVKGSGTSINIGESLVECSRGIYKRKRFRTKRTTLLAILATLLSAPLFLIVHFSLLNIQFLFLTKKTKI
jgi:hypothetical protein